MHQCVHSSISARTACQCLTFCSQLQSKLSQQGVGLVEAHYVSFSQAYNGVIDHLKSWKTFISVCQCSCPQKSKRLPDIALPVWYYRLFFEPIQLALCQLLGALTLQTVWDPIQLLVTFLFPKWTHFSALTGLISMPEQGVSFVNAATAVLTQTSSTVMLWQNTERRYVLVSACTSPVPQGSFLCRNTRVVGCIGEDSRDGVLVGRPWSFSTSCPFMICLKDTMIIKLTGTHNMCHFKFLCSRQRT